MLRVGRIPYLNSEPFFAHLQGVQLFSLPPRLIGEGIAAGRLDAGPVSLAHALTLRGMTNWLPFGIATPGAARSVLLFSRAPLHALEGAAIGLTDESAMSVRLVRLLAHQRYGLASVRWTSAAEGTDGVLLIGDEALRRRRTPPFACCTDLGAEWTLWTGLPCPFAVWVVANHVSASEREALASRLGAALARGMREVDAIARRRGDTGLGASEIVSYLRNFIYEFGPLELQAAEEFHRRWSELASPAELIEASTNAPMHGGHSAPPEEVSTS